MKKTNPTELMKEIMNNAYRCTCLPLKRMIRHQVTKFISLSVNLEAFCFFSIVSHSLKCNFTFTFELLKQHLCLQL